MQDLESACKALSDTRFSMNMDNLYYMDRIRVDCSVTLYCLADRLVDLWLWLEWVELVWVMLTGAWDLLSWLCYPFSIFLFIYSNSVSHPWRKYAATLFLTPGENMQLPE